MTQDLHDLEGLYFVQLTCGCNNINCINQNCHSSHSFQYKFDTISQAQELASRLAQNHSKNNLLCNDLSPLITNPKLPISVVFFQQFINNFIHGKDISSITKQLKSLIAQPVILSHIFIGSDEPISRDNLNFNISLINDFVRYSLDHQQQLEFLAPPFQQCISQLITQSGDNLHILRGIIIAFLFPTLWPVNDPEKLYGSFLKFIFSLSDHAKSIFYNTFIRYPDLLRIILDLHQKCISLDLTSHPETSPHSPPMHLFAAFTQLLSEINDTLSISYPPDIFASKEFSSILLSNFEMDLFARSIFSYVQTPAILSLLFKKELLKAESLYIAAHSPNPDAKLEITVSRSNLLKDTISIISSKLHQKEDLHMQLSISFAGEGGHDDGGLSREFFQLVFSEIFKLGDDQKQSQYFEVKNGLFFFKHQNIITNEMANDLQVIGALVGLALYNEVIIPVRFPILLFKSIFGIHLKISDITELDPELAHSLQWMLEASKNGDAETISSLGLTFSVDTPDGPDCLIPGGDKIPVTVQTINEFIDRRINYFISSNQKMFNNFTEGFMAVCDTPMVRAFSPTQLSVFISGEERIDIDDLENKATYVGYTKDSMQINAFWDIFRQLDAERKGKLLMFITGSQSTPVGGISITIEKTDQTQLLPTARTCFNRLILPEYPTKEKIQNVIDMCIEYDTGFGIA